MVLYWLLVIVGLLAVGMSVPLVMGKIPRNRWYGIKMPASYKSDENWYRINRVGGWITIGWGITVMVYGAALLMWGAKSGINPVVCFLALIPMCMVLVVIVALYGFRLDKQQSGRVGNTRKPDSQSPALNEGEVDQAESRVRTR